MTRLTLAERVVAIHGALGRVPHAFGGALALAYYAEPRATIDIDLNLFVAAPDADDALEPLAELGVAVDGEAVAELVERDGQVRVFWDATPLDLFFAYDPFHDAAARDRREVPFADTTIEILSREHLMVCKAVFDRPKDWVDLDAMLTVDEPFDAAEVLRWVGRITGDTDRRYERIAALLTRR